MSLLIVFAQTTILYLFLILVLGRLGRSLMAALTPVGYMVIALLGSSVETGLYHGESTLASGLLSAATIIGWDYLVTRVMNRWPGLRHWLLGTPVVLISNGHFLPLHLRRARLTEADVQAALRKRGYDEVQKIRLAVLEVDGAIAIIPRKTS